MIKNNLVLHAKRELQLAGMFDKDADYNGALAPHIIKVVEAFSKGKHSGASAMISIGILEKLLRFQTLTPITNNPKEWMKVGRKIARILLWQNKRDPSIFSKDGGKTWYNVEGTKKERIKK